MAGCASAPAASGPAPSTAAPATAPAGSASDEIGTITEQGVEVDLRWDAGDGHEPALAATFTPLQPGFHLYSVDLPAGGAAGVGRPTTLEVGGGLVADGRPVADRTALRLPVAGLDEPVPVYPDGPVTVRLPVRLTRGQPARAWVGYAACSRASCLPPVTRRQVTIAVPGSL